MAHTCPWTAPALRTSSLLSLEGGPAVDGAKLLHGPLQVDWKAEAIPDICRTRVFCTTSDQVPVWLFVSINSADITVIITSSVADPDHLPGAGSGIRSRVSAGLRSRNYFFPLRLRLRLSKSFGSGSGSGNSRGTTCFHRFYVNKDIFHVFNERKST